MSGCESAEDPDEHSVEHLVESGVFVGGEGSIELSRGQKEKAKHDTIVNGNGESKGESVKYRSSLLSCGGSIVDIAELLDQNFIMTKGGNSLVVYDGVRTENLALL